MPKLVQGASLTEVRVHTIERQLASDGLFAHTPEILAAAGARMDELGEDLLTALEAALCEARGIEGGSHGPRRAV